MLDISLGKSDAIEVIRKLGQLSFSGRLLLISGHPQEVLREVYDIGKSHGLAMLPALRKPFRGSELRERLNANPEVKLQAAEASRRKVDIDLPEAIKNKQLELWYQPKIDLTSLSICGGEALIRLRHPEHGVLSPADFLPPTNDPLFDAISIFVMSTALKQLKFLIDQKIQTKIAVNMPASFVTDPGFISNLRMDLPSSYQNNFIVEITEDEVIHDVALIREVATQLKILNVGISIDDFGVAHASLARLRDLPCIELKLDRSFVLNCSTDRLKRGICKTVADLAKRFKISVCAEGVETTQDLKTIMEIGFDTAQGYLFAKPMPFDGFVKTLIGSTTSSNMNQSPHDQKARQSDELRVNPDAAQINQAYEQQKKLANS